MEIGQAYKEGIQTWTIKHQSVSPNRSIAAQPVGSVASNASPTHLAAAPG
jgi:hypothetical protein